VSEMSVWRSRSSAGQHRSRGWRASQRVRRHHQRGRSVGSMSVSIRRHR
jgi:hypothetical protein